MGGIYFGGERKWAIACINSTPDGDFVYVS